MFCAPDKKSCVVRQPKKDKSCLVPCIGLYTDFTDDFLKRKTETSIVSRLVFLSCLSCLACLACLRVIRAAFFHFFALFKTEWSDNFGSRNWLQYNDCSNFNFNLGKGPPSQLRQIYHSIVPKFFYNILGFMNWNFCSYDIITLFRIIFCNKILPSLMNVHHVLKK